MNSRLLRIQDWERLAREAKFRPALMADLCPISLRQLERFFVEQFHETPRRWTRALRCRLARQLISDGWSIDAVVAELHFGNASQLCHDFKKLYGITPLSLAPLYG